LFGGEIIRKKIKGYLKNITEKKTEIIEENAILNKDKLTYVKNNIKHTIINKNKDIILIRENKDFKNILTFSQNRSILSEYIIKENNLSVFIEIETIKIEKEENRIYIKYKIVESDIIYEYKITMED